MKKGKRQEASGRSGRCRCGQTELLNKDGEGICFDCHNKLGEAKNQLVRENYDLLAANKALQMENAMLKGQVDSLQGPATKCCEV